MDITVVGAGVIGLTVARALEQRGHVVQVIGAARPEATTSAVAGAVWFPFHAGESPEVAAWALRTRAALDALADDPETGVDRLTFYECTDDATPPWWADSSVVRDRAPVAGAPEAWRFTAPRVEPARFLPWLERQLARPIAIATIADVRALPGDRVIVCAGLGARALVGDAGVGAVLGQVVVVEPGTIPLDISFTDDRGRAPIFYSIPRRAEVVLGGLVRPHDADLPAPEPDPAITQRILAQCRALGWEPGAIRAVRTGLRPVRAAPRLARDPDDPRVIHAYGHGGAGYTLCLAVAEDVAALVDASA
ncbi:MAG: FAD-binding oxidoreductase [Deltaproteobacteria bacterium]|nr:FAD-binding oxidoreductase [Deltaproteobacteria bacterium]